VTLLAPFCYHHAENSLRLCIISLRSFLYVVLSNHLSFTAVSRKSYLVCYVEIWKSIWSATNLNVRVRRVGTTYCCTAVIVHGLLSNRTSNQEKSAEVSRLREIVAQLRGELNTTVAREVNEAENAQRIKVRLKASLSMIPTLVLFASAFDSVHASALYSPIKLRFIIDKKFRNTVPFFCRTGWRADFRNYPI